MKVSIRALRVNAEMKQEDVAKALNVSKSTVISWEKGNTAPTVNQLTSLCNVYGCTISDVFLLDKLAKS